MKKFLPRTSTNTQGFTLIELLIVIAIIAILSVIGVTVFTGVQKKARDSARKADVESIANAIEVNYDESTGKYKALKEDQFAQGAFPKDPMNTNTTCLDSYCGYCGVSGTTTGVACAAANIISTTVPVPVAGNTSWVVCANLETAYNGSNHYCKSSIR